MEVSVVFYNFAPKSIIYNTVMNLAVTLKERRQALGISQVDLAEMAGIGIATVKSIECGKANPSLRTVEALAEVLGLELSLAVRKTV